jgi:hypothetical protein
LDGLSKTTSEKQLDILYKIFNNVNQKFFENDPILALPVFPGGFRYSFNDEYIY